jgi:threonine dehydrogenase-like Zn-dependent dehydrogenase
MDTVKEFTGGLGADIVVESSGHPQGIDQALSLVRPRGTVSVKTTCGLPAKGLDMTKLVVDEISLQGSRCGPFQPALKILTEHQKKLKSLISSIRPLDEIQSAIESAFNEQKVVVQVKKNTPKP